MARCPFAQQRILPENATQAKITPRAVILHTAVDGPGDTDLAAYFGQANVKAESHFYVTRRGVIVQMMDTGVEADANGTADKWAISVETEDDSAPGPRIAPWNQAQLDAIAKLVSWCCATHNIPIRRCTSAKLPGAAGIGCHSQPMRERFDGTAHNPWTAYQGKTCPGDERWQQYPTIVARVAAMASPNPPTEDVMTHAQEKKLDDLAAEVARVAKLVDDLAAEVARVAKLVDALAVGPGWGHRDGTLPLLQRVVRKLGA